MSLNEPSALARLTRTSFHRTISLTAAQAQVDGAITHALEESSRLSTLGALLTGTGASRLARTGILALGANATGWAARGVQAAATVGSLCAEVVGFEAMNRFMIGLISPIRPINSWRWSGPGGWREGLFTSGITFTALRGAGRAAQGQNIVFQHTAQSSAMVAGHNIAGALRIIPMPEGAITQQFFDAEIMNVQLAAMMSAFHTAAPGVHVLERSLDLANQSRSVRETHASPLRDGWGLLLATGSPSRETRWSENGKIKLPHILLSENNGGDDTGNGPRKPRLTLLLQPEPHERPPSDPPPVSDSVVEVDFASLRLTQLFESSLDKILQREQSSETFQRNREEMHEILTDIAHTPRDSTARAYLSQTPYLSIRRLMRRMSFEAPPLSASGPSLRLVGQFRLRPEARALLHEMDVSNTFGKDFRSFEYDPVRGVSVYSFMDERGLAVYVGTSMVYRPHPKSRMKTPHSDQFFNTVGDIFESEKLSRDMSVTLQPVIQTLRETERRFPEATYLAVELDLWVPSSFRTNSNFLEELLPTSFNELAVQPEAERIARLKVNLRDRTGTTTISLIRSRNEQGQVYFENMNPVREE